MRLGLRPSPIASRLEATTNRLDIEEISKDTSKTIRPCNILHHFPRQFDVHNESLHEALQLVKPNLTHVTVLTVLDCVNVSLHLVFFKMVAPVQVVPSGSFSVKPATAALAQF